MGQHWSSDAITDGIYAKACNYKMLIYNQILLIHRCLEASINWNATPFIYSNTHFLQEIVTNNIKIIKYTHLQP